MEVRTDADDNTIVLIDFGDNLFCVASGTAAGGMRGGFGGAYYGTKGTIDGCYSTASRSTSPTASPPSTRRAGRATRLSFRT